MSRERTGSDPIDRKRIYDANVYQIVAKAMDVRRGFMKNISGTLLALGFVFFALISLVSVNPTWDNSASELADNTSRISELGLRYSLQR
jgi:hypothetical protein